MTHLRAQSCDFAGTPMRFCQKCSRFHELDAFEARRPQRHARAQQRGTRAACSTLMPGQPVRG
jgi:hypothetical protein